MSDLYTRLDHAAGPTVAPSSSTVDADLARGRRALRRRRFGQFATGSSFAVAAVVAAALAGPALTHGGNAPPTANGTSVSAHVPTRLVAYTGKQPAGFSLDRVPQGWEVQGVNKTSLTLAPKDAKDKNPASFVGKIGIELERGLPDVPKKDVRVGDKPGVLATMKGDTDGRTLFVKQPSGAYLVIQVWNGLNWGENEIIQFATGVHLNPGAGGVVG